MRSNLTNRFIASAESMLLKFGFEIFLDQVSYGEFNVDLGEKEVISTQKKGIAIFSELDTGSFVETFYSINDIKAVLIARFPDVETGVDVDVSMQDIVIIDGINYKILKISPTRSQLTNIIYELHLGEV